MSMNVGDSLRMPNSKKLQGRNYANTNYQDIVGVNSNDEPYSPLGIRRYRRDYSKSGRPVISTAISPGGVATGTAGDLNILMWPSFSKEYLIKGTQTIKAPSMTTVGLDIGSLDQTADDGLELIPTTTTAGSSSKYTIGTSPAFYYEAKIKIEDVSGTDDLCIGFRKDEAGQANVDDYNDGAWLQMRSGDVYSETIVGNAATTSTDTTKDWADGETHTVRIEVSSAGAVTYKFDGQLLSAPPAYSFTTALSVMPFIFFLQDIDIAGKVEIIYDEDGYL